MKRICLNILIFVVLSGIALRAQTALSPQPPTRMAADADPSFEVATIRPSDPAATAVGFRVGGRKFSVLSTSLSVLIQFAYGVDDKQIVGAPDWLANDKYDIVGVRDKEAE
jgi:hypothetical protein